MIPKKVFISYAWDDQPWAEKVLKFANSLRENGIDAIIDQYEENPPMGWPIWMENQIENSEYVLVVATETYMKKFRDLQEGKGVTWEISSIYQSLYDLKGHNDKFIPIVFEEADIQYILKALRPYTYYNISTKFKNLVNRIKGIPNVIKPEIKIDHLPHKERRSIFVSKPINKDAWDKAVWKGTCFLPNHQGGFELGFLFEGDSKSALKIFTEWKNYPNLDDYIYISFIEGDIEQLPPNGYTCLISPNIAKTFEIAKLVFSNDEKLVIFLSRFQRMYPKDNFAYFNYFKQFVLSNNQKKVSILPITIKDKNKAASIDNIIVHEDYKIETKNIKFLNASDIKKDDFESVCIPKFNKGFPSI